MRQITAIECFEAGLAHNVAEAAFYDGESDEDLGYWDIDDAGVVTHVADHCRVIGQIHPPEDVQKAKNFYNDGYSK